MPNARLNRRGALAEEFDPAGDYRTGHEDVTFRQFLEPFGMYASGMLAEPLAGLAGVMSAGTGGDLERNANTVRSVQDALTFMPRSDYGQSVAFGSAQELARPFQAIGRGYEQYIEPQVNKLPGNMGPALSAGLYAAGSTFVPGPGDDAARMAQRGWRIVDDIAANGAGRTGPADRPRVDYEPVRTPVQIGGSNRIGTTGKYRGGPAGLDSPQKLGAARKQYLGHMEDGAGYRHWYDKASQTIHDLTGQRPGLSDRFAGSLAATSSGTQVPANMGAGIKGYNQGILGAPVETGRFPKMMGRQIQQMFDDERVDLGPKTGPFRENLSLAWNDGSGGSRGTNDIREARAWGYHTIKNGKKEPWDQGLSEAQHRWLDHQREWAVAQANARQVGGADDWNGHRAQAAGWISEKAKSDKKPINEAGKDFSDFQEANTTHISVESMPGSDLGHLPGLTTTPDAADAYHTAHGRLFMNEGRSRVAQEFGMLTRPSETGPGYWEGGSDPVDQHRVLTGKVRSEDPAWMARRKLNKEGELVGPTGPYEMDDASRTLVEGAAATEGLLGGQKGVGYNNMVEPRIRTENRSAYDIPLGRKPTKDEIINLGADLDAKFGSGRTAVVFTENGPRVLSTDFKTPIDPAELGNYVRGVAKKDHGVKMEPGRSSGGFVGDGDAYLPSSYLKVLDDPKYPHIAESFDRVAPDLARDLIKMDAEFSKAGFGPTNEMLTLTRQIIADEGLAGLRKAVNDGRLPVALLAAVLAGMGAQDGGRLSDSQI